MTAATIKPRHSKRGPQRGKRILDPERRREFAEQRRSEDRERLEAAVAELASSEGWRRWVESRQRFHSYSFCNTALIAMQRPDATLVASYGLWQSMGRQVMRGQRGIRILAPMVVKDRDAQPDASGEQPSRVLFKSVAVFDVAQTDGDELPTLEHEPITGDSHAEHLPALERFAAELGYSVTYSDELAAGVGGYCDRKAQRIVVRAGDPANARVRTLVHELAHALGASYTDYGREVAEVLAETAGVVACGSIGLDTSGEAVPYVAGWAHGDVALIRRYAEAIDELARKIERALEDGGAR
jgi:N-terminal domain of anti-restriction factor ArdC